MLESVTRMPTEYVCSSHLLSGPSKGVAELRYRLSQKFSELVRACLSPFVVMQWPVS